MKTAKKYKFKKFSLISTIIFIFLFIYALSLLVPIFWAFLTSLKDQIEYTTYNINGLPRNWLFSNYSEALKMLNVEGINYFKMTFNSLWYSVGGASLSMIVVCMDSYVVAKYRFPGRKVLYNMSIIIMLIPIVGTSASWYKMYEMLGVIDTPFILIAHAGGVGSGFLIMYSFFKSLPWSYAESAFIDGASDVTVFFRIMLPQAITPILANFILGFIGLWNDTNNPLLYMKSYPTLASGLLMFQMATTRDVNMPVLYAGLLISVVPVLILFSVFAEKIMSLSIGGGLKG